MSLEHPDTRPIDAITRTSDPVRRVFHALISLLGWGLFGVFLYRVFILPMDGATWPTFFLLSGLAIGTTVIHLLWVRFNVRLHRTRPARNRPVVREHTSDVDTVGRPLAGADWEGLRAAGYIQVELEEQGRIKRYVTCEPVPPAGRWVQARRPRRRTRWTG